MAGILRLLLPLKAIDRPFVFLKHHNFLEILRVGQIWLFICLMVFDDDLMTIESGMCLAEKFDGALDRAEQGLGDFGFRFAVGLTAGYNSAPHLFLLFAGMRRSIPFIRRQNVCWKVLLLGWPTMRQCCLLGRLVRGRPPQSSILPVDWVRNFVW